MLKEINTVREIVDCLRVNSQLKIGNPAVREYKWGCQVILPPKECWGKLIAIPRKEVQSI